MTLTLVSLAADGLVLSDGAYSLPAALSTEANQALYSELLMNQDLTSAQGCLLTCRGVRIEYRSKRGGELVLRVAEVSKIEKFSIEGLKEYRMLT